MIRAPRQRILGSMEANGSAQDVFCYFIFYSWTIKSAVCVSAREQCRAYLFAISLRIFLNNFLLSNEQAQKRARKRGRASALTMCRKKVFLFLFQYPSPILSVLRSLNFFSSSFFLFCFLSLPTSCLTYESYSLLLSDSDNLCIISLISFPSFSSSLLLSFRALLLFSLLLSLWKIKISLLRTETLWKCERPMQCFVVCAPNRCAWFIRLCFELLLICEMWEKIYARRQWSTPLRRSKVCIINVYQQRLQ